MEVAAAVGVSVGNDGVFVTEVFTATGAVVPVEGTGAEGEAQEVMRNIRRKKMDVLILKFEIMDFILPPVQIFICHCEGDGFRPKQSPYFQGLILLSGRLLRRTSSSSQ